MVIRVERSDQLTPVKFLLQLKLSPNTPKDEENIQDLHPGLHLGLQRLAELVVKREVTGALGWVVVVCPGRINLLY